MTLDIHRPFQSTKYERLNLTLSGERPSIAEAARLIAPLIQPYLCIRSDHAAACFGERHVISLHVAPTDLLTRQIESEGFYHNAQHFTSADLQRAVEIAYPERFL